jgi:hypothetical protein
MICSDPSFICLTSSVCTNILFGIVPYVYIYIYICFDSAYDLFDTYKRFVLVICRICLTCIHICSGSSYNLFSTYKYFVQVVSKFYSTIMYYI